MGDKMNGVEIKFCDMRDKCAADRNADTPIGRAAVFLEATCRLPARRVWGGESYVNHWMRVGAPRRIFEAITRYWVWRQNNSILPMRRKG